MDDHVNRRNRYWIVGLSAVMVVGIIALLNNQHQQRLQVQAMATREQSSREALLREQNELTLRNDLQAASQREAALQLQLGQLDAATSRQQVDTANAVAGANQRQADNTEQAAKRRQAEKELQDLRAQRIRLEKQVDCEKIQLSVNQLKSSGEVEQALKLQTLWNTPCPNLQTSR